MNTVETQLVGTTVRRNTLCAVLGSNMIADHSCTCREFELKVLAQSTDDEKQAQRARSLFFRQLQARAVNSPLRPSLSQECRS